jgi:hypothetical protein
MNNRRDALFNVAQLLITKEREREGRKGKERDGGNGAIDLAAQSSAELPHCIIMTLTRDFLSLSPFLTPTHTIKFGWKQLVERERERERAGDGKS